MREKENILHEKTIGFAIRIVKLYQYLLTQKEFVMSKQLLRSGTAIGALVREAEHAESKPDFIHKLAIALKEANESSYWIELLVRTEFINMEMFASINDDCNEVISILVKIIKTTKNNLK
jgi:four helix bundle protein